MQNKVDKKVANWVEKCVDTEYKKNQNKYDSMFGALNGRIGAALKVSKNLNNFVTSDKLIKTGINKARFMVLASDYANRIENWCDQDNIQRYQKNYYKDELWRNK